MFSAGAGIVAQQAVISNSSPANPQELQDPATVRWMPTMSSWKSSSRWSVEPIASSGQATAVNLAACDSAASFRLDRSRNGGWSSIFHTGWEHRNDIRRGVHRLRCSNWPRLSTYIDLSQQGVAPLNALVVLDPAAESAVFTQNGPSLLGLQAGAFVLVHHEEKAHAWVLS